ncbi:D-inositol 3-phosphate glycosyltransferase [Aquisphaera giovannonii]|uniref:D-inositol 3-phosphate glycosyltransferase n=1 Tax=Aquisphaera giovannonii TaxID=406548 RepID=A0A5B9W9Z0_9BACT|nr:glycosyltransferase family 1 protein [Aquisphaera giovannonii]QEH36905.1 D-inositol 3-phosphate glycosyltransferase [Aquisphaera giovannonii]
MRIGFDGTCLANRRGFGRFSRLLLDALARQAPADMELIVFLDRPSAAAVTLPTGVVPRIVDVAQAPAAAASASGRRRVGDMLAMSRAVARAKLDVMYFPATYTFFPVWNVRRLVVTMHDTLALAHPDLVFPTRKGRVAWLVKEHIAARMADRIVTVSETSRRDLQSWFRLPADRLRVVTEGPAPVFRPGDTGPEADRVLRRHAIPSGSRYFLYVGGLSPHKNVPRLVEAFSRVAAPGVFLVVVGDFGDVFHTDVAAIRAAIDRHGIGGNVILPGFVPDDDLLHLYRRAVALVQPSLMEGFGLPPVEAMACGTPVVASRAGSLPEILGDAGLLFEPTDIGSIAGCLRRILDDLPLRDRLAGLSLQRSHAFTWELAARQLLECLLELGPTRRLRPDGSAGRRLVG